jgi:hypothetical protein
MKKLLFALITITITSLSIQARNLEISEEKFNKVEMNVEALMKVISYPEFRVIVPDTADIKYIDLIIIDNILKVSYSKPYYKDLLQNSPVRLILAMPDSVEIVTTKDYELKKTKD